MILRCLYGKRDGHWLLMHGARLGIFPQATSAGLVLLGNPARVVTEIYDAMRDEDGLKQPHQEKISCRLGVGQQVVSRYLSQQTQPKPSASGSSRPRGR